MRSRAPESVNLFVTRECNYECRFCFGHLRGLKADPSSDRVLEMFPLLRAAGCEKLTLTGGEPYLCQELEEILRAAKVVGLTTCAVTNGSLVTKEKLQSLVGTLDWIGLSLDSASERVEMQLRRGYGNHIRQVLQVASWAHELGIRVKVNTVVTSLNYDEDMTGITRQVNPARWKAFQVLPISGENHKDLRELEISDDDFKVFISKNKGIEKYGVEFIPETCDDMEESYVNMLTDGRFFSNHGRSYRYGKNTMFDVGVQKALDEVGWDREKFIRRGGRYDW